MPSTDVLPHCVLECWDTKSKAWIPTRTRYESIAAATSAATERGVYRVVYVHGDRKEEMDAFAIT